MWIAIPCFATVTSLAAPASPGSETSHLGAYAETVEALARPVAVAFGPDGDGESLFVAVQGGADAGPGVVAVPIDGDALDRGRRRSLDAAGIARPAGIVVDARGDVWVTDDLRRSLWRLPREGGPPVEIDGGEGLVVPAGLAAYGRDGRRLIAVADVGRGAVLLYDAGEASWRRLGESELCRPVDVAFVPRDEGPPLVAVCDAARHRVDLYDLDGSHAGAFGDWGVFPSLLSSPMAIAFADDRLFLADSENHRVQAFALDADSDGTATLSYRFGLHAIRPGEGEGSLHYPAGLAIDAGAERLALAEPLDDRVQIFRRAPGDEPADDLGRAAIGPPDPHLGPTLAAAGQYLATTSPETHRIQIHDVRLEEPVRITEAFSFGTRLGMLRSPSGVWLGDEGRRLLTVDVGNGRLTRSALRVRPDEPLAQDPELARHLDAVDLGALLGAPVLPVAVTKLADPARGPTGGQQPVLFTADGRSLVLDFGPIAVADRASDTVALLDERLAFLWTLDGDDATGPLRGVAGLAATERGTLLVADAHGAKTAGVPSGRVLEFDARGNVLQAFGEGLIGEAGAVAAHAGRIWVTDRRRDRIEIFQRGEEGRIEHVRGFGQRGLGVAEFRDPRGVAALADGRFVVLDYGNHRGQIFDSEGNFLGGFGSRLYVKPLRTPR